MTKITTQKEFFHKWSMRTGVQQKDLKIIWEEMLSMVKESANEKDETKTLIPGIGNIHVKPLDMRKARNPKTGRIVIVEPSRKVLFKVLPSFKQEMNEDKK